VVGLVHRQVGRAGQAQPVTGDGDRVRDVGHLAGEAGHQPVELSGAGGVVRLLRQWLVWYCHH
jgi:hypothetical protein